MKITQYIRNSVDNKRFLCGGRMYLGQELGSGVYGVVYMGVYMRNSCAIKVCYQQEKTQSNQVKYARIIKGDYLPQVIEVEQFSKDLYCIVMPKYKGTLQSLLDMPNISQKQKQIFLKNAVRSTILGLRQLSKFNLSHRDIHADNVMYDDHLLGRRFILIDYTMLKQFSTQNFFRDKVFLTRMIVKSLMTQQRLIFFPKPNFDDPLEELKNSRLYESILPQWAQKFLKITQETSFEELLSFLTENVSESEQTKASKKVNGKDRLLKANKKRKIPAKDRNDQRTCPICLVTHKRKDTRHLLNHPGYVKKTNKK